MGLVCVCALTDMAGSSSVSSATTVAAECIPCLGTATTMLTIVRNTPEMTDKQTDLLFGVRHQNYP